MPYKYLNHDRRYAILRGASIFTVRVASADLRPALESMISRTEFKPSALDSLHPSTLSPGSESRTFNRLRCTDAVLSLFGSFDLSRRQAYHLARSFYYGNARLVYSRPRFKSYKMPEGFRDLVIGELRKFYSHYWNTVKAYEPDSKWIPADRVKRAIVTESLGGDYRILSKYVELMGANKILCADQRTVKYIADNWNADHA